MMERFGCFCREAVLLGKDEIRENCPELLEKAKHPEKLKEKLNSLESGERDRSQPGHTLGAGLLAGFNPCSISMLLMLFSILITTKGLCFEKRNSLSDPENMTYLGLGKRHLFCGFKG